jgi:hypothetical protein
LDASFRSIEGSSDHLASIPFGECDNPTSSTPGETPPGVVSVDGGPQRILWVQLVGYEIVDPVELALEIWLGTIPGHGLTLSLAMRGSEYLR